KIGVLFSELHQIKDEFCNTFDYWGEVVAYKSRLNEIPHIYKEIEEQIQKLTMNETNRFVPCHIDPLLGNFIQDDAENVYLVDWEYSANYLPEWDLAAFI